MLGSYPTSWKEPYQQALKESDKQKLTELVQAAQYAIVLRLQELENSTDNQEERIKMKRAATKPTPEPLSNNKANGGLNHLLKENAIRLNRRPSTHDSTRSTSGFIPSSVIVPSGKLTIWR